MALSLISQHQQSRNCLDLQTLLDPYQLQHQQQPQHQPTYHQQQQQLQLQQSSQYQQLDPHPPNLKSGGINCSRLKINQTTVTNSLRPDYMEYTASNLHQNPNHNHYQLQQNNNSSGKIGDIHNGSNNNIKSIRTTHNNSQILSKTSRYYMHGLSHQHISSDYVITFVDSPPNSEESWTDEQSKGSPGPQIIDVQTIYSNSGTRKRRMDWESLDIGQTASPITAHSGESATKTPHQQKEKQKKEKAAGRGSWTEDIGFDLNADFNSNSYLTNESFLSFSPALTVLKQEPQTDQIKAIKSSLDTQTTFGCSRGSVEKLDKATSHIDIAPPAEENSRNPLKSSICGCGSPKTGALQEIEHSRNYIEKSNTNEGNGFGNAVTNYGGDKCTAYENITSQQLAITDVGNVENSIRGSAVTNNVQFDDHKFQYILAAATSIATKNNEETLTYLNQGQSYEIKLKKVGDLSFYRDKILKSVIKICFHERRLQFMEREQMQQWQASRPGERIIEVDVPLSYGLCHVSQPLNPNLLNIVEIFWDPLKEVGVYIKVNCISTEFTPKKHGGEKGVPFRLQIETYIESTNSTASAVASTSVGSNSAADGTYTTPPQIGPTISSAISGNLTSKHNTLIVGKKPVHAAACQIKVFKLKGADRKHKQDREKIQRRPQSEQEKLQPSYECTIMNDIVFELVTTTPAECVSPEW